MVTDLLTIPSHGPSPISNPWDRVHQHPSLIGHELIIGLFPEVVKHVGIQDRHYGLHVGQDVPEGDRGLEI